MSGLTACLVASLMLARAPVPPEKPPDPLGRGYMGVWFSNQSLTIDRLEPNMPAEVAGLKPGDLILRVNSLQATSMQEVIDHVCSYRPGASVEIEVQRGGERKTFKFKLAARPPDPGQRPPEPPIVIDP